MTHLNKYLHSQKPAHALLSHAAEKRVMKYPPICAKISQNNYQYLFYFALLLQNLLNLTTATKSHTIYQINYSSCLNY